MKEHKIRILLIPAVGFLLASYVFSLLEIFVLGVIGLVFHTQNKTWINTLSYWTLNVGFLVLISFYFFRKYFNINILKQPFHLQKFKIDLAKNLAIGSFISLSTFPIFIFIHKIITPSLSVSFVPSRLAVSGETVVIFLTVCIMSPIAEEILFRGFFYRLFSTYLNPKIAIIINVVLGLISHMDLAKTPSLILLIIILCLSYSRTGTLHKPILIHASFNTTGLILSRLLIDYKW